MVSVENFVDPEHGVVITLCSGYVNRTDVVSSITTLRKDPSFRPSYRQLINLMDASKLDLDFKDLYGIRQIYDPFSSESRRAIVAPHGGAVYELAQMYRAIVDSEHMEVFVSPARRDFVAGPGSNGPGGRDPARANVFPRTTGYGHDSRSAAGCPPDIPADSQKAEERRERAKRLDRQRRAYLIPRVV
jgi:hypothetical protein